MMKRWSLFAAALSIATSSVVQAQGSEARVVGTQVISPIANEQCVQIEEGRWLNCGPTILLSVTDANNRAIALEGFDPLSALTQDGKSFGINGYLYQGLGFNLSLSMTSNPDPFVTYGLAVTNTTGNALNFLFSFSSPYIGGPYTSVHSSHSSSYPRNGTTNASINAYMGTDIHRPFVDALDVTGAFIAPSCLVSTPPASGGCLYAD